jgi:hypothetical protein
MACRWTAEVAQRPYRPAESERSPTLVRVHVTRVADGYLNTMGIPLLSGRFQRR